jgi:hypothetical protein
VREEVGLAGKSAVLVIRVWSTVDPAEPSLVRILASDDVGPMRTVLVTASFSEAAAVVEAWLLARGPGRAPPVNRDRTGQHDGETERG